MSVDLPTSDMTMFEQQLKNPNTPFEGMSQKGEIKKIKKSIVLSYQSDNTGCGHLRNIFPMTYLNAAFGKSERFNLILSPVMIFQDDVLMRARSIYFQRTMDPRHVPIVQKYKHMQQKYGYKMVYDYDDFIFRGPDDGEEIPEYNFGSKNITPAVMEASIEIMKMMDTVCVSTEFLGEYTKFKGVDENKIKFLPNHVTNFFWGPHRRRPIKQRIKKPKIISSASPTHYHNGKKLKGDFNNAWYDWIVKNVIDDKIEYIQMGGLPWFFEPIKDKIKIVPWVNSFQYHLPIKELRPDFSIGPLVPNYFNYSKSFIKYEESCAYGAAFIGSTFENIKAPDCWKHRGSHAPSPYDVCELKLIHDCKYEDIDDMIWENCEPDNFNKIIKNQYNFIDKNQYWLESPGYVKLLTSIF